MRILLICHVSANSKPLEEGLLRYSYAVDVARSPEEGVRLAESHDYDAILAQEGDSSSFDSIKMTRRMRNKDIGEPILLIPADHEEDTITEAFDAGADQVMDPDHGFEQLVARIRALLRQCIPTPGDVIRYHDLEIDLAAMRASRNGQSLGLIGKPFAMLELFVRRPEKVLTREEIGESVWDKQFDPFSNVIDVTVSKLRQRLDKPFDTNYLHTIVGSGYMLNRIAPSYQQWG